MQFANIQLRLSGSRIQPLHYVLGLYDLDFGGDFSYAGTVKIDIAVKSSTKVIVLNSNQLQLNTAQLPGMKSASNWRSIVSKQTSEVAHRPKGIRYLL